MSFYMNDVVVFKTSYYMHYGVYFADMSQKFVTEAFSFWSAFYKTGNIAELYGGVYSFFGIIHVMEHFKALVRDSNDSDIRLYCTERIIGSFCSGLCNCVEKSTFTYIGKSNDS